MKKTIYTFMAAALSITAVSANAQLVTTIAGKVTSGYSGDGSAATAAELNNPLGLAADGSGNVYFADYNNHVVRKIDAAGTITTVAGSSLTIYFGDGGDATAAGMSPTGVAVDGSGNLYIADNGNHCIRKVNTSGIITTIAGTGSAGSTGDGGPATAALLNGPYSVDLDAAGNIFIADRFNHKIRKVDVSGNMSLVAGTGTSGSTGDGADATAAKLSNPLGVAVDAAGNIYVADYSNNKIRKINTSGIISTIAGTGVSGTLGDGAPATAAQLAGACYVEADGAGNIYIAEDATGNLVRVIDNAGVITRYAGFPGMSGFSGEGGPASTAKFYNIRGVTTDPAGNVYISDAGNHRIRRVNTTNNAPSFTSGATQSLTACENATAVSINSLLVVSDSDPGQTKTWSVVTAPAHGSLTVSFSTTSTGGALTPTGLSYTPTTGYSGSDVYSVRVTDGLGSDTISISVTINPAPLPVISATLPTLSTTLSYSTYQWLSGTTSIAGETNATYTATADGSYAVTVTDAGGCAATSAAYILSTAGMESLAMMQAEIYPNPVASGQFTINLPSGKDNSAHLIIINLLGQKVYETDITTNRSHLIKVTIPQGIYTLSATTEDHQYNARIIIK